MDNDNVEKKESNHHLPTLIKKKINDHYQIMTNELDCDGQRALERFDLSLLEMIEKKSYGKETRLGKRLDELVNEGNGSLSAVWSQLEELDETPQETSMPNEEKLLNLIVERRRIAHLYIDDLLQTMQTKNEQSIHELNRKMDIIGRGGDYDQILMNTLIESGYLVYIGKENLNADLVVLDETCQTNGLGLLVEFKSYPGKSLIDYLTSRLLKKQETDVDRVIDGPAQSSELFFDSAFVYDQNLLLVAYFLRHVKEKKRKFTNTLRLNVELKAYLVEMLLAIDRQQAANLIQKINARQNLLFDRIDQCYLSTVKTSNQTAAFLNSNLRFESNARFMSNAFFYLSYLNNLAIKFGDEDENNDQPKTNIDELDETIFADMDNLRCLQMENFHLTHLSENNCINKLTHLDELILINGKIERLEPNCLAGLVNLRRLEMRRIEMNDQNDVYNLLVASIWHLIFDEMCLSFEKKTQLVDHFSNLTMLIFKKCHIDSLTRWPNGQMMMRLKHLEIIETKFERSFEMHAFIANFPNLDYLCVDVDNYMLYFDSTPDLMADLERKLLNFKIYANAHATILYVNRSSTMEKFNYTESKPLSMRRVEFYRNVKSKSIFKCSNESCLSESCKESECILKKTQIYLQENNMSTQLDLNNNNNNKNEEEAIARGVLEDIAEQIELNLDSSSLESIIDDQISLRSFKTSSQQNEEARSSQMESARLCTDDHPLSDQVEHNTKIEEEKENEENDVKVGSNINIENLDEIRRLNESEEEQIDDKAQLLPEEKKPIKVRPKFWRHLFCCCCFGFGSNKANDDESDDFHLYEIGEHAAEKRQHSKLKKKLLFFRRKFSSK